MGGFLKTASVRPGGVNPNDKTVMINPPGAYMGGGGGLMKTFHRLLKSMVLYLISDLYFMGFVFCTDLLVSRVVTLI